MGSAQYTGKDSHLKALGSLILDNSRRHRRHEVFRDFCEIAALTISNSVDTIQYEAREARYMELIKRYEPDEIARFPEMFACLVNSLERDMTDALGQLFMSLELGDAFKGQFFTPYEVAKLMARMTLDGAAGTIEQQGFIILCEPAAGAGAMVIACAETLLDQGINYQNAMHATCVDVDATAVHMAYIQLALLHIPAIVVHGNSLSLQTYGHWVTPAHVLGRWDYKLRRRNKQEASANEVQADTTPQELPEVIAAVRTTIATARVEAAQLDMFG